MGGELEQFVIDSVAARGSAIGDSDAAAVALARSYAAQIDAVPFDAGQDRTKVLYLGPHLLKVLSALGCTPDSRGEASTEGNAPAGGMSILERMKAAGGGQRG